MKCFGNIINIPWNFQVIKNRESILFDIKKPGEGQVK